MKTKQIVVLISTLVAGIVLAPAVFAEEAEPFELDFSKLTMINVSFGGWWGLFWPDGAARLERNQSHIEPWETANAPAGSFSFEEIYALVAPHLKVESVFKPKECLIITFSFDLPDFRGMCPYASFYIEDQQVARTLMHGLRAKAVLMNERGKTYLEEMYSKYPLVSGEEPDSFKYGVSKKLDKGTKILYGSIFVVVCMGAVLWFIRKKAKQIIVLISILVAGIVLTPTVFAEEVELSELDFNNVREIYVSWGNGNGYRYGYCHFWPNGAARLDRFPPHHRFGEIAIAPAGSFSFEEIYALVAPPLKPKPDPNFTKYASVVFFLTPSVDDKKTSASSRITNEQVLQTLMDGLKEKTVPLHKTFLEELHSKYPPVPGKVPDSFRYGSKMNIPKWLYGGILAALCAGAALLLIRKKK